MANREEGAAMLNQRQGQEQPQHQDAVGQRHIHLNWSNFKPEFLENQKKMQKHIYYAQMIGWRLITLMKT